MTDPFHVQRQAIPRVRAAARRLRLQPTPAEATLWALLRSGRLRNRRFRRQHAIGGFIVDFYCSSARVAIELDGLLHDDPTVMAHDRRRTLALNAAGITVLRFSNDQVRLGPELVLASIVLATSQTRCAHVPATACPPPAANPRPPTSPSPTTWERGGRASGAPG